MTSCDVAGDGGEHCGARIPTPNASGRAQHAPDPHRAQLRRLRWIQTTSGELPAPAHVSVHVMFMWRLLAEHVCAFVPKRRALLGDDSKLLASVERGETLDGLQ